MIAIFVDDVRFASRIRRRKSLRSSTRVERLSEFGSYDELMIAGFVSDLRLDVSD